MKMIAFAIYDAAAEAYLPPMFLDTKGMAIRSFQDAVNDENSAFSRHAADYTLFHVGFFDMSSGLLEAVTPDQMGNALQYVVRGVLEDKPSLLKEG